MISLKQKKFKSIKNYQSTWIYPNEFHVFQVNLFLLKLAIILITQRKL